MRNILPVFRVYDTKKKHFVRKNISLTIDGDLQLTKLKFVSLFKLHLLSTERYICQMWTQFFDIDKQKIYEGDICEAMYFGNRIIGQVTYVAEKGAYLFLDFQNYKYYSMGSQICIDCKYKVIGNIFDEKKEKTE